MNPHLLLAFWGLTLLLIIVPGPDWAFILASSTRDHVVLPAVGGLMLGYSLLTLLVAAGVGALVGRSPTFLTILTTVGAGYLIYLGVSALRRPSAVPSCTGESETDGELTGTTRRGIFPAGPVLRGIGVSGLNPKGLLIFVAMLPQFTDPSSRWPTPVQLTTLGLIFVLTCGAFYTVVGISARTILGARSGTSRFISRLSGAAMIIVGILLISERLIGEL